MTRFLPLLMLCATPVLAQDPASDADARAVALFTAAFTEPCVGAFVEDGGLIDPPQRFQMVSASSYSEPETVTLWQFRCNIGAYNMQSVFLAQDEFNGLHVVAFARPDLKITYEDPENEESAVKEVAIVGWSATTMITNATFDVAKAQVSAASYWRGIGDAADSSVWSLVDGEFRMVHFEVDASYDGKITPQTLVDFK